MIQNWFKARTALLVGGSITEYPTYMILGIGSSTLESGQTILETVSGLRQLNTSITNSTQKVNWIFDWNSNQMSGLNMREFALLSSGTSLTGSIWTRDVIPALQFNGTNELRISENIEIF